MLVAVAAFAAAPAIASATTWCVQNPTCPAAGNASQSTIQGAVTAAATGDTILIGPGKYLEAVNTGGKSIDFIGAGASQTVIQSPTPGSTTLAAGNGGTIEDLGVELASGTGSTGLFISGAALRVAVTAPAGTTSGTGATLIGATFEDGSIALPLGPGVTTVGAASFLASSGAVQDSSVTAADGLNSVAVVARDRVLATRGMIESSAGPAGGVDASFVVDDVAIETVPGATAESAISSTAVPPLSGTASLDLTIRHSTFAGSGAVGSTGLDVHATAGTGDVSAAVTLDSSIVVGYGTAIDRVATGAGGHNATASVDADYSDLAAALETSTNGGAPAGTGSIVNGAHDVNVAPAFVNTVLTDRSGFHLLATSALIDAGNTVLGQGESPADGDGAPRTVAGRSSAKATSDIGAFEFQPHAPIVGVTGPSASVLAAAPATFAASATDPDPGDALTFSWRFDDGTTALGANVSHAFAKAGVHTATVTVSDLEGLTASAAARALVVSRPPPLRRPAITKLTIRPANLLVALSGPTIAAAGPAGAIIAYRDSQTASTTFTVLRLVPGVRRNGHCARLTGQPGHRARCVLALAAGRFIHSDVPGVNRFRFSGRIKGRQLAAGSYRLTALPRNAAGAGPSVSARFRAHH